MKKLLLLLLLPGLALAQSLPEPQYHPLATGVYVHTSYRPYQGQPVPSNGLIVETATDVVLIDTGWDLAGDTRNTRHLLDWVQTHLHKPVGLCIVTHAHDDRLGGIGLLQEKGIPVWSTPLTAQKARAAGYAPPAGLLPADTTFAHGGVTLRCFFPGEGHTPDNLVVWLPAQRLLHGGCLVKSVAAFGLGNIADANLKAWGQTIRTVIRTFPTVSTVVPGHDAWGDATALTHTLHLLEAFARRKPAQP